MGKQVIAAAIFNDEAVSLGIIEPFDFASWHDELPCSFAVTLGGADCSSVLVPVYGGQVPEARQVLPYYWFCVLNSQRPGGAGTVANNVKPVLDVALGYTLKHEFTFFNNAHYCRPNRRPSQVPDTAEQVVLAGLEAVSCSY